MGERAYFAKVLGYEGQAARPYSNLLISAWMAASGRRPTISTTFLPSLNRIMVGTAWMPYCSGESGLESMSHLRTLILPSFLRATSSTMGPRALQGPHHSAQK